MQISTISNALNAPIYANYVLDLMPTNVLVVILITSCKIHSVWQVVQALLTLKLKLNNVLIATLLACLVLDLPTLLAQIATKDSSWINKIIVVVLVANMDIMAIQILELAPVALMDAV